MWITNFPSVFDIHDCVDDVQEAQVSRDDYRDVGGRILSGTKSRPGMVEATAGGTSPGMDESERCLERAPRATHGAVVEDVRTSRADRDVCLRVNREVLGQGEIVK